MMRRLVLLCVFISMVTLAGVIGLAYGDSAQVLPKGVLRAVTTGNFYSPVTERFNPDGKAEPIAIDFNANMNSNVFPDLALVEEGFGMETGSASLGRSVVDFKYQFYDLIFEAQYGLTDNLTIGLKIPYYWNKNTVNAALDTSAATVGLNPYYGRKRDPFMGSPLVPITMGGIPLTTKQVKALLGPGLDINGDGKIDINGYGYEAFDTWSGNGVSDIELVARYQYYKSDNWALAFTGGVRFPTGELDDPDNLVDIGFGNGAHALLFRVNNDYTGIKNLTLDATFRYDLVLPTSIVKRVLLDVNRPLSVDKEDVDVDLGDVFDFRGSATYEFLDGLLSLSLEYRYTFELQDAVSGRLGFNYNSLEEETDATYHAIRPGITLSTINLYKAKEFTVPLTASLEYENIFAGTNNFLKQQLLSFKLALFF
jgi:hypothetical protein